MEKRSSALVGMALIALGVLSLAMSALTRVLGFDLLGLVWRMWPSMVVGLGALLVVVPLLVRGRRGLGALWIPGFPILATGTILFLASVLNAWQIWAWLWPMELLALAMGFLAAAVYMRVSGLAIPAIIIGLNGLVMQFCAITGLWHWWAVLWVVEPLSVGLALLGVGAATTRSGMTTAGLILCGIAAAGLMLMITILGGWWPVRLAGSGLMILGGLLLLAWGLLGSRLRLKPAE